MCDWIFPTLCDQHAICPVCQPEETFKVFLPPAVVGVGSVGFSHLVQLVFLLDNVALLDGRCQQLLGKFFIHVSTSVFVVPALCDHPFHGEEALSVFRKRDGHLGGKHRIYLDVFTDATVKELMQSWITAVNQKRTDLPHLIKLSTFLDACQPNNRFTVLQSLVKDFVGVTFDLFLLPLWSFMVFLHLFPLYVLQSLIKEW